MLRLAFAVPLALAALAAPPPAPCPNLYPHEPAVLFEVSGYTLAGPYDLELAVYGDGYARLSSASAGKCQQQYVGSPRPARCWPSSNCTRPSPCAMATSRSPTCRWRR